MFAYDDDLCYTFFSVLMGLMYYFLLFKFYILNIAVDF